MPKTSFRHRLFAALALIALGPGLVWADGATVDASGLTALPGFVLPEYEEIDTVVLPAVSMRQVRADDEARVLKGEVPHYAFAIRTDIDPWGDHGSWEPLAGDFVRWRLRLQSHGALSLNLGFTRFHMPPDGSLSVISADGRFRIGPFTQSDNDAHGQLWTPPMLTSDLVLELVFPLDRILEVELELGRVNHGYAGFGDREPKAGSCHVDVACVDDDTWLDQARSVGLVSVDGVRFCTGFLVNNTALDGRPFFITAHHCGIDEANAPSVVVIWNHQQLACPTTAQPDMLDAARSPETFSNFQTGAILRAAHRPSDALLLELDDAPSPSSSVFFAGWDRSGSATGEAVVIHHPNTDVKRISFDFDATRPTLHLRDQRFVRGAHLRVGNWEIGSTEGGSSGAPLFDQNRRVVGQLHGGYAACGERRPDWFGRFSASWRGNGEPDSRFSDWLDPLQSDAVVLDGIDGTALLSTPIDIESPSLGAVRLPQDPSVTSSLADR